MQTLQRACAFGPDDGAEPSRVEQLGGALLVLRRLTRVVLGLALLGVVFSGVLAYRELGALATAANDGLVAAGGVLGQPHSVYSLLSYVLIAVLSAYALASTRVGIGDELTR
jgi:hypothetical protein